MPSESQTQLVLSLRQYQKAIPYPAVDRGPNDSTNHGFKALKGASTNVIGSIPEAAKHPALVRALLQLNAPDSVFFTVGCEVANNKTPEGEWLKGYLEIGINYAELAHDAISYFKLFFGFNHFVWEQPRILAMYHFELEGAQFLNAGTDGFTATVWITTSAFPRKDEAESAFGTALDTLVGFCMQQPQRPGYKHIW
jgi:hypothetical protein